MGEWLIQGKKIKDETVMLKSSTYLYLLTLSGGFEGKASEAPHTCNFQENKKYLFLYIGILYYFEF